MTPIRFETFNGGKIDPEKYKGKKVRGFLYWHEPAETNPLEAFEGKLLETLTGKDPKGFHQTEDKQKTWLRHKASKRLEFGEDALVNLFPDRGHRAFTGFLNALTQNKINTISQLVANEDRLPMLRHISSKNQSVRLKAARLIVDYFKKPSPAARA